MTILTGSEKQITWAAKIRAQLIADFDAAIEKNAASVARFVERGSPSAADRQATHEKIVATINEIKSVADASLWIDARDGHLLGLIHAARGIQPGNSTDAIMIQNAVSAARTY